MSYLKRCRVEHLFSILTVIEECVIRCQALHVISNLIQHQLSDIWRKRELWLIRQYTDFLRDLSRYSGTGGGGAVMRGAGCRPVTLWVDRKIINCGRL